METLTTSFPLTAATLSGGDAFALLVGMMGCVVGAGATVAMWRQHARRVQLTKRRHPSLQPYVSIYLVDDLDEKRWRVALSARAAETSIDIVTYRPRGHDSWISEPVVVPIVIQPGGWALLPTACEVEGSMFDVVVAWTEHRVDGPVEGSQLFAVSYPPPRSGLPPVIEVPARGRLVPALLCVAGVVAFGAMATVLGLHLVYGIS